MAELLRMPEVAAASTTAVLSAWPLAVGTAFDRGDPVAVVGTDKAEVEIPADAAGVLLATLVQVDAEVEVGSPIAVLGAPGELVADLDAMLVELGVAGPGGSTAPSAVRRDVLEPTAPSGPGPSADQPADPADRERRNRIFSSPLARRTAKEAGLQIHTIRGTGPGGRIVRRDVTSAIASSAGGSPTETAPQAVAPTGALVSAVAPAVVPAPAANASPPTTGSAGYEDVPHTRMRRAIAARLVESKQTAPHFYLRASVPVDALLELRSRLNEAGTARISVNDLLVKAVGRAHVLVPEMNAVWTPDAVRRFAGVDVSVAISTEKGLVTPVLRGVEAQPLSVVSATVRRFAEQAKAGTLQQSDLEGGSITVTNLGMYGAEEFTAIVNPPQAAILAVGAARAEAVVLDGKATVAQVMRLVLSVDHRPVDGAVAARWMAALTSVLGSPLQILV